MKKLINRIKYDLLKWLLGDICKGCSDCKECLLGHESEIYSEFYECSKDGVYTQAKKAWGLEDSPD